MNIIIAKAARLLQIQKPYKIILKPKLTTGNAAEYYALYRKQKLSSHIIRINLGTLENDTRCINTLVVHEFIHAWQEETGLTEVHGKYFKGMAKILSAEFDLPLLYIKGVDK